MVPLKMPTVWDATQVPPYVLFLFLFCFVCFFCFFHFEFVCFARVNVVRTGIGLETDGKELRPQKKKTVLRVSRYFSSYSHFTR